MTTELDKSPVTLAALLAHALGPDAERLAAHLGAGVLVGRPPPGARGGSFQTRMAVVPNPQAMQAAGLSTDMLAWPLRRRGLGAVLAAPVRVGRAPSNDVSIPHPDVSKLHATLHTAADGRVMLVDESSLNGTWVNGRKVEHGKPVALHDGDHVGLGGGPVLQFFSPEALLRTLRACA